MCQILGLTYTTVTYLATCTYHDKRNCINNIISDWPACCMWLESAIARGCHTYTYCRAICDRGQTQSQLSRSPKTIRSQVQQEITQSRDKTKTLTHNQIKRILKVYGLILDYTVHFASRCVCGYVFEIPV